MLTNRGRIALALGGVLYVAAWAFGSEPLYPVAVGLVLAGALAWAWVRVLDQPMRLRRSVSTHEPVEGDDLTVTLELESDARVRPSSVRLIDRVEKLGDFELTMHRSGRVLLARHALRRLPRGKYRYAGSHAVLEDPFGLAGTEIDLPGSGALLVYPRLVAIDALFSEAGSRAQDGRRLLLRRPTGFDLHSVREYEDGESLRKVHWPTTARRGRLMVKDLEDSPRDEVAVLLDAAAGVTAGDPPDSSFDMQVRAAGSILKVHARRGRRAVLVLNSAGRETQSLRDEESDWRHALELLAAAEPTGTTPAAALLAEDASPAARALELAVVSAQVSPALVDRLVQRSLSRRPASLVFVDPASFVAGARAAPQPGLLRLQAAGVPVVVLRQGDDLTAKLSAGALREVARG
jgi:uncharacterized protein (DUF58 family)